MMAFSLYTCSISFLLYIVFDGFYFVANISVYVCILLPRYKPDQYKRYVKYFIYDFMI